MSSTVICCDRAGLGASSHGHMITSQWYTRLSLVSFTLSDESESPPVWSYVCRAESAQPPSGTIVLGSTRVKLPWITSLHTSTGPSLNIEVTRDPALWSTHTANSSVLSESLVFGTCTDRLTPDRYRRSRIATVSRFAVAEEVTWGIGTWMLELGAIQWRATETGPGYANGWGLAVQCDPRTGYISCHYDFQAGAAALKAWQNAPLTLSQRQNL
ncbi:hypothetical protein BU15DRAFT_59780 [Melanogaster broomeanus]|nr:hypothetical protein BU15DRAFT_59780 [Melanogaster broomeanus]